MDAAQSLAAFTIAATLVTVMPGLDTALVLRTTATEGGRRAMLAALGIGTGCFAWGAIVACGLGALLVASQFAYDVLKWAGAAYLFCLGLKVISSPCQRFDIGAGIVKPGSTSATWFCRGFLTNILNPKVGVFYVSFLPQFIPAGTDVPALTIMMAAIHVSLGLIWFAALITATRPIVEMLRKPAVITWLNRITGSLFIAFGVRVAFESRR